MYQIVWIKTEKYLIPLKCNDEKSFRFHGKIARLEDCYGNSGNFHQNRINFRQFKIAEIEVAKYFHLVVL